MKLTCLLLFIATCAFDGGSMAVTSKYNNPATIFNTTHQVSLAQDIREILLLIPSKEIQRLIIRYLLNDAQFQSFVRIINSNDGYLTQWRFRSQPEVMQFVTWARSQMMLSGDDLDSVESNESLHIINRKPFWSTNVFGWQGFVNEFNLYYPEDTIRMHVQTKATQSSVFAQFVQRLKNLKPAYERTIGAPEAKRVINALETNGIPTAAIDLFIRNQFGWQQTADNNNVGLQ